MDQRSVVVNYSQIVQALRGEPQRGLPESFAKEDLDPGDQIDPSGDLIAQFREALYFLEKEETHPSVLSSPQHRMAAAIQSYFAEQAAKGGKVVSTRSGLEAKFDSTDVLGWAKSFLTWFKRFKDGRHPLPPAPERAQKIDQANLRIAVLGDWGTGMYGAPICANTIDSLDCQIALHLGDVYYSGTPEEEQNRFLNLWPKLPNARHYALNSNHEMYTGGYGYFDTLLRDDRFKNWQSSSYFALYNDNFLLIGLDTAYEEHDICDEEQPWLDGILTDAGTRTVVLFSHHQPFSLLDKQGPKLQARLSRALDSHKIAAWYWGHEHRCVVYDSHPRWKMYGRCIGHSGYPYFRGDVSSYPKAPAQKDCWRRIDSKPYSPGGIVLDGPNPYVTDAPDEYGPNGFLTLEITGSSLVEYIHDPKGEVLYSNLVR